jgi:hypothetical protein
MPWRELDTGHAEGIGNQINKRVVRLGQVGVDGVHHLLRSVRASDGEHAGVHLADQIAFGAGDITLFFSTQAAGDDDAAIGGQGFANRVQAFFDGIVDETAGVDDDQVRTLKGFGGLVALGAQLGQDQLRIGQRLGATEADEADFRNGIGGFDRGRNYCAHPPIVAVLGFSPRNLTVLLRLQAKRAQHGIGLLLHLLHGGAHHALQQRVLSAHSLRQGGRCQHVGLLCHFGLQIGEGLYVFF